MRVWDAREQALLREDYDEPERMKLARRWARLFTEECDRLAEQSSNQPHPVGTRTVRAMLPLVDQYLEARR